MFYVIGVWNTLLILYVCRDGLKILSLRGGEAGESTSKNKKENPKNHLYSINKLSTKTNT